MTTSPETFRPMSATRSPKTRRARAARSIAAGAVLAALLLLVLTGPALASEIVRMNGDVEVLPGERYDSVVVMNGDIVVRGHVDGDAFAANGDILVADGGYVGGNAVSLTGQVDVEGSGRVEGERVEGELSFGGGNIPDIPGVVLPDQGGLGGFGWFFLTLGAVGLGLLLMLISAPSLHSVGREVADHPGRSTLVGALSLIGVPVAFIILAISVIGIPLALLMIPAVPLVGIFGMYAIALLAGGRLLRLFNQPAAGDLWAMIVGVILVNLVLVIPVLGWLLFFVAGMVAFGATLSRMWEHVRARRKSGPVGPPSPETWPAPAPYPAYPTAPPYSATETYPTAPAYPGYEPYPPAPTPPTAPAPPAPYAAGPYPPAPQETGQFQAGPYPYAPETAYQPPYPPQPGSITEPDRITEPGDVTEPTATAQPAPPSGDAGAPPPETPPETPPQPAQATEAPDEETEAAGGGEETGPRFHL